MSPPSLTAFRSFLLPMVAVLILAGCTSGAPQKPSADRPPLKDLVRHDDDHQHHDDELLVLDPPADYESRLPALGLSIIEIVDLPGIGSKLYRLRIEDGAHPFHARDAHLDEHPEVVADVHHHFEQHQQGKNSRPLYTGRVAIQWGMPAASCGDGIRLGQVDGGVDLRHPAFKNRDVTFRSFHLKGQKPAAFPHGTAVASILVGSPEWGGLLPAASLSAANVFHARKKGKARASTVSILKAVSWLITRNVQVINFSIGGSDNKVLEKAIAIAVSKGAVLVASAGNNGPFTKKKSYPGAHPSVIAVAASDPFGRSARFSSAGDYVEFTAPGVGIWSAVPGGGKAMSGTSFSSPIVAAYTAAAIRYTGVKGLTPVRNFFKANARQQGKRSWDKYTGWGIVHLKRPC